MAVTPNTRIILYSPWILRLHPEIGGMFADEMDMLTLIRWRLTCKTNYYQASAALRRSLLKLLGRFVSRPKVLLDIVTSGRAVFGGELALAFLLRDPTFVPPRLEVFAGDFDHDAICATVLGEYSIQSRILSHSYVTYSLRDALRHLVSRSLVIHTVDNKVIYIHRSYTTSPTAPMSRVTCTALSNFVTGYGFACSHPRLTLQRRGLIADMDITTPRSIDIGTQDNLSKHGFDLALSPDAWPEYQMTAAPDSTQDYIPLSPSAISLPSPSFVHVPDRPSNATDEATSMSDTSPSSIHPPERESKPLHRTGYDTRLLPPMTTSEPAERPMPSINPSSLTTLTHVLPADPSSNSYKNEPRESPDTTPHDAKGKDTLCDENVLKNLELPLLPITSPSSVLQASQNLGSIVVDPTVNSAPEYVSNVSAYTTSIRPQDTHRALLPTYMLPCDSTDPSDAVVHPHHDYENVAYDNQEPIDDVDETQDCWRHLYICPCQGRFFGDRGSLVEYFDPLNGDEAHCIQKGLPPFGPMMVWRLLSTYSCDQGCDDHDDVLDEGVTSVSMLFIRDPFREVHSDKSVRFGTSAKALVRGGRRHRSMPL